MPTTTIDDIRARKGPQAQPLVCLTAYSAPMASMLAAHCDVLLVGDSLGMVLYGMDNTLGVDLEMMIRHGQAVRRGAPDAFVVVDLPYGSYEDSPAQALSSAQRVIEETGCAAVKLEGGATMAGTIAHLTGAGIAVMGHVGLLPQSVEKEGGYKIKGKDEAAAQQVLDDARAVEVAGAFSMVLEGTVEAASDAVVAAVSIPVIGIGASASCDGQILVTDDMLGLHGGHIPKFVKQYKSLSADIESGVQAYAADVRGRAFPTDAFLYKKKAV